ncbi:ArsR family transcriptional regulator [Pseudomonas sp.]|uniref:ArsR family transcriptional regulator n=1 Tax=Pseudomonas sp. TaxID=306 RepID=UPI003D6E78FA
MSIMNFPKYGNGSTDACGQQECRGARLRSGSGPFPAQAGGPQATAQVAQQLGVTAMAVRQHLSALYGEGLVEFSDEQRN